MTDAASHTSLTAQSDLVKRRNAAEKRFRAYGLTAIMIGLAMLVFLVVTIVGSGWNAFFQTRITVQVELVQDEIDAAEAGFLKTAAYRGIISANLREQLTALGLGTDVSDDDIEGLISRRAPAALRDFVRDNPDRIGDTVEFDFLAQSFIDGYFKNRVTRDIAERSRNVSVAQLDLIDQMRDAGLASKAFNLDFITGNDASESSPEAAGYGPAILGSLAMMIVVAVLAISIGVAASIFLEEFAPQNRLTDLIEVNISNLAAVPSIVFGILGLAVFINYLGPLSGTDWLKNNSAFVGGLVLSLMTLPTIIIATRASLKAVPQSIRDAALGVGASKMQTVFHHVLPLAAPGILTGSIIGLAQALGESAPLLLVGLVLAQGAAAPETVSDFFGGPNTAMPAQIYQWSTRADPAFYERAWGGIIILLIFLVTMNTLAVILRRRFERRW
ncbi:MAG: phosphate ABC transporter permease PstA [Pseudomonadota bacterium]